MGRKESALSLELERSMNMQIRVETFEEHLRHASETVWMIIKVRICPSQTIRIKKSKTERKLEGVFKVS